MLEIEAQLERLYPQYRRIWVQYSDHRGYRVCITLFPSDYGRYQMIFGVVDRLTFENIHNLIENYQ